MPGLIVHETRSQVAESETAHIQALLGALAEDSERTATICDDVADALQRGRNCIVLTVG